MFFQSKQNKSVTFSGNEILLLILLCVFPIAVTTPWTVSHSTAAPLETESSRGSVASENRSKAKGDDRDRQRLSERNLKELALTQMTYASSNEHYYPPAFSRSEDGKPLLSWRVLILPQLGKQQLYDQFHLDEPWDSEHNKKLIPKMPRVFKSPSSNVGPGKTTYLSIRGEDTIFSGESEIRIQDVRDGTSNTLTLVEASDSEAVVWTKPDDFIRDPDNPLEGLLGVYEDGFLAGLADGRVLMFSSKTDIPTINALITHSGGEPLPREIFSVPVERNKTGDEKPTTSGAQSYRNLRKLALSLHYYHEAHNHLPPAFSHNTEGAPLLSWRKLRHF